MDFLLILRKLFPQCLCCACSPNNLISLSTWHENLAKLGLRKKLKASDWLAIAAHLTGRENLVNQVYFNEVLIPEAKVKKEIKRNLNKRKPPRFDTGSMFTTPYTQT